MSEKGSVIGDVYWFGSGGKDQGCSIKSIWLGVKYSLIVILVPFDEHQSQRITLPTTRIIKQPIP